MTKGMTIIGISIWVQAGFWTKTLVAFWLWGGTELDKSTAIKLLLALRSKKYTTLNFTWGSFLWSASYNISSVNEYFFWQIFFSVQINPFMDEIAQPPTRSWQRVSQNQNIQMGQFFCNLNWFSSIVFMADIRFSGTSDHKSFFYNMFVCQTPIKSCGLSVTVTLAMWYTTCACGVTPAPVGDVVLHQHQCTRDCQLWV